VAGRNALLSVRDLRVEFWTRRGTIHAVNGISFDIAPGETLGIVGESGCGKSVTSLALLGILPRAGRVPSGAAHFEGRDLLQMSDRELRSVRGREIAMIFQDPMTSLNPVLTIGKQIREALQKHFGLSKRDADARVAELLDRVGIPGAKERAKDYPHQFSGGMRQRAMIAMALACKPKLLIADEPTTALDVTIQAQILDLLRELVREEGSALILITHDLGVVAGMCERVNVMYAGMFMETGRRRPAVRLAASPVHARAARVDSAARRTAPLAAEADRRRAARHAEPSGRVPVPTAMPLRGRAVARGGSAARRDRAGPLRRVLQPGARRRVGARARGHGLSANGGPLVELDELKVYFPIKSGLFLDRTSGTSVRSTASHSRYARRDARLVGRVGLRQVDDRSRDHAPVRADRGTIVFDGKDVTHLSEKELRPLRRRMQMVFQDPYASLNPRHSVGPDRRRADAGPRPRDEARHREPGARAARHRRAAGGRGRPLSRTSSPAASGSGSASLVRSRSTRT
jgi:ABC-type microcin C transport system duplicated ATPase subunit YejF